MAFTLAIIGRPNTGKSTLFNRLTGRKLALVDGRPGVTRDRREGDAKLGDLHFKVIDTAGLEQAKHGTLEARMHAQTQAAMETADMILLLTDARAGILPEDKHFAALIRKRPQKIVLAANKYESQAAEAGYLEAYELGLGEPIALSAEHGHGMGALYDILREAIMPDTDSVENENIEADENDADGTEDMDKPLRVAILGRPNTGKSTLINYLLGEERLLTGPEAGITRDSIRVLWQPPDESHDTNKGAKNAKNSDKVIRRIELWDTAGVRKKAGIREKLEKLSVADGLRAVCFAEVVVLLIDATTPFDKQDIQLADLVEREGRALVIAINKWDLPTNRAHVRAIMRDKLETVLSHLKGVPVIMCSAKTGQGVAQLMPAIAQQQRVWGRRINTAELNKWLAETVAAHPPPTDKGRVVRLRYITQAKTRPPVFVAFSSRAHAVPTNYIRYLTNSLRAYFDLPGVPIRFFIRKNKNPYVKK